MSESPQADHLAIAFCQRGIYGDADSTADQEVHLCPACLDATAATFAMLINTGNATQVFWKQKIRTELHGFCVQLVTFITLERDSGAHQALQTVLQTNLANCPLKRGGKHSPNLETLLETSFDSLFTILDVIIKSIEPMMSETRRFSTKGAWPANSAEMLPHGAARSCRGLIFSWINFDSSSADDVLFLWFIVCSHDLLAELIAQRASFVPLLLARIDTVTAHAVRGKITIKAQVRRFRTLAGLLVGVITAYQWNVDAIQRIFGDVKSELVPTFVNIAHATLTLVEARMLSEDSMITTAHKMIVLITAVFQMNSVENIMAEVSRLDVETAVPELHGDAFKAAFRAISITRREKRCDTSGCTRYGQTADGAPAKLQRCSRCKFFAYCSRECQRAHWSARLRPHKEACPLFVDFQMRVAPLDEALTELNVFSEKCRASGVQLDELMTLQYYATTTFAPEVEPYIDEHKQQWISGFKKQVLARAGV